MLTVDRFFDIISLALSENGIKQHSACLERYRSGHNEAVLKTVCPQGRVGSNPTLSVRRLRDTQYTSSADNHILDF